MHLREALSKGRPEQQTLIGTLTAGSITVLTLPVLVLPVYLVALQRRGLAVHLPQADAQSYLQTA